MCLSSMASWASLTSQRPAFRASLMGSGTVPRAGGLGGRLGPGTDQAASAETITEIGENPDHFYINIHNDEYPAGAVRGQLEYVN